MTTRQFIAARFGVDLGDLAGTPTPPTTSFTMLSEGGAYGYGWRSPKFRCDVCHATGHGLLDDDGKVRLHPWAEPHKRGHSPCPWCNRQLTLRKDGTPRVHARCPTRPDHVELLRETVAEVRVTARYAVRGPMGREADDLLRRLT